MVKHGKTIINKPAPKSPIYVIVQTCTNIKKTIPKWVVYGIVFPAEPGIWRSRGAVSERAPLRA
jgi:hypothetical protein